MTKGTLLVAGGGIAGIATALAAGKRAVTVLEQAVQFEEVGAGLQLGPNAVRALQKIGAWSQVEPIASSPPEIHMRDGISGKLLKRIRLGQQFERRFGAPYRVAHRAELHTALLQAAQTRPNIEVHGASRLTAFEDAGNRVIASLETGRMFTGAALIGADGVRSAVRKQLFPDAPLIDSGMILHRALFPVPRMAAGIAPECVNLWLCPGAHVVHYPVGRQNMLNVVATTRSAQIPSKAFAHCCEELKAVLASTNQWLPWPAIYVKPVPRWNKGNVMILGDASHGTLPFLAQGAAMALEDTATLASALEQEEGYANAFEKVSGQRQARAQRLLEESLQAGRRYHATGLTRAVQNLGLSLMPQSLLLGKLTWIYRG